MSITSHDDISGSCMEAEVGPDGKHPPHKVIHFDVGIMSCRLCPKHAKELAKRLNWLADTAQGGQHAD